MAVTKELHQFNTYEVFKPIVADSLSSKEKKKALSLLIFLKEKQNGIVKHDPAQMGVYKDLMLQKKRQHPQQWLWSPNL
jgi:hypothetical protein